MPTLMLTQRLWRRFGLAGRPTQHPNDNVAGLGNWTAIDVTTRYGDLALFVNQRTCLVAVTPLLPLRDAMLLFAVQVGTELERLGVPRGSVPPQGNTTAGGDFLLERLDGTCALIDDIGAEGE